MASFKRRQSSDYNQSVPETQPVPETHAYQEKHFQPTLNQPVSENHSETEYGSTVTPDRIENRDDKSPRSTFTESSDQPGEDDLLNQQIDQNLQGNSDAGTQYSTPDVSSGVTSGPGGYTTYDPGTIAAASSTTAASTVVVSSTVASVSSVAVATVGTVVIAATLILPLIIGVPSAIIFEDISVTDTTVYYSIYFEDYEEDMDLTVCLHNNFTNRTHTVESESISVLEEGLKPGMEYKITVYGSMSAILEEKTVRTDKGPSGLELDVKTFDYRPQEGKVYLDSELIGNSSGLSAFKAVVYTDIDGVRTVLCSSDMKTLDGEQPVSLEIKKDKKYSATFVIEATYEDGATLELYSNDFTVYGTPYYSAPSFSLNNDTLQVICGYYDPYSARSDYTLVTKVMNTHSTEPIITYTPLNSGVTTIENISGGYEVYEIGAHIEYTEDGSSVMPPNSTYDYNSLDDLITVGTARASYDPQSGYEGHLTLTVGDCSETLTAYVRVVSNPGASPPSYAYKTAPLTTGTGPYTFDLLSIENTNSELQFYVVAEDVSSVHGAYGNVVFAYASYTGTTATSNLNPSLNGPGIELTDFTVNDPYNLWSDYRATVTQDGTTTITLCSDVPIVDNKVYFTNTNFENGTASLTVTCTQDGATVTVIDRATLPNNVYSGPTFTLDGELYATGQQLNEYEQTIDGFYAEFDEFGTSGATKVLYAYLYQGMNSTSSHSFTVNDSVITFELDTDLFVPATPMDMEIRDSENNLIARLDNATYYQV